MADTVDGGGDVGDSDDDRLAVRTTGIYDPHEGAFGDPVVVVADGRVVETRADVPADVPVHDHDGPAIPGLVDAHSHASIRPGEGDQIAQLGMDNGRAAVRAVSNLRRDLAAGTTTMRLMAATDYLDVALATAERAGELDAPRLLPSGVHLTPTGGHGLVDAPTDGVDAIRRRIRENVARGATHTKFFSTGGVSSTAGDTDAALYTRAEVDAIVDETHRHGRHVATHAHGGPGARIAIEAGVDTIEHAGQFTDREVALLDGSDQFVVGTFAIAGHPDGIEAGDGDDPAIAARLETAREATERSWRALLDADVRVAVGTDSMHGYLWYEVATLVEYGATPAEALNAATLWAARAIDRADEVGSLEAGKRADLVCLDGDPLTDPGTLRSPAAVYKDGERVV